ncbi:MAG: acyltransferase family protein [Microthrixaceae bacterium]
MEAVKRPPRRLGSLDGLRALAVAAVVVYHLDDRLLPGGFLGVDVFFVLSGYLITSLLVAEDRRSGSISLRGFWARRARRLWAAAWIVLALVALAGLVDLWGADRQALLPGEIFAAVAHIENYWVLGHGGYLSEFAAPSPVRHFWSLAVEEQFYMVWPLVMLAGLAAVRRHGRTAMFVLLGVLGAASISVGFVVSPEQAYLGTATRAIALIVGALLAWWWSATPLAAPDRPGLRRAVGVWAGIATAVLLVGMAVLHPHDEVMRHGGFLTVAVAAAGLCAVAVVPGRAAGWLSWAPLVWLGRRSYGIYLLHWPLIVAMGPGRPTWLVALVVVPTTLLGAAALHRLVEEPLIARRWKPSTQFLGTGVLALVIAGSLLLAVPHTTPTRDVAAGLDEIADPASAAVMKDPGTEDPGRDGSDPGSRTTTTECIPTIVAGATEEWPTVTDGFDPITVEELADPTSVGCESQLDVMVVGDSTGRGLSNGLARLGDPSLRVWDRTTLGCSLGDEDCPDWRTTWADAVEEVRPDVVVLYVNPVMDLKGIDDEPFLSRRGEFQRLAVLHQAADLLSSEGAALVFVAPPSPRPPEGLFFCDGRRSNTECDPAVTEAWTDSVIEVATERDIPVLDVAGFLEEIGDDPEARPDGMHFSLPALDRLARWALPALPLALFTQGG